MSQASGAAGPTPRQLMGLALPALAVGVACSVVLVLVSLTASTVQRVLWTDVPAALGQQPDSGFWIVLVLTVTGFGVGLVVRFMPGHAGPDPATTGLVAPPLDGFVLPGLALAAILMLAGGVSLGPENPIIALNIGLAWLVGRRALPSVKPPAWVALAAAGTIGAMFGTPLAAALIFSEVALGEPGVPLWDRLFTPLVAAGAGAATTALLGAPVFSVPAAPYPGPQLVDLATGSLVGIIATGLGLAAVFAFPMVHRAFGRLGDPIVRLTMVGFVLGLLGMVGGTITLFKGLGEMQELTATASTYTVAGLAAIAVIKLVALVFASGGGFRGGRIFPSVFVGVAIGLCANALVPDIPQALAIGSAIIGILVATTRSGWLSLFMAAVLVPDPGLLPVLCIVILPCWVLAMGRPIMEIPTPSSAAAHAPGAPAAA